MLLESTALYCGSFHVVRFLPYVNRPYIKRLLIQKCLGAENSRRNAKKVNLLEC